MAVLRKFEIISPMFLGLPWSNSVNQLYGNYLQALAEVYAFILFIATCVIFCFFLQSTQAGSEHPIICCASGLPETH